MIRKGQEKTRYLKLLDELALKNSSFQPLLA